jgi:hypothetical protein
MPSQSDYLPTPSIAGVFDSLGQRSDANTEHSSTSAFSTDDPDGARDRVLDSVNSDSDGDIPNIQVKILITPLIVQNSWRTKVLAFR